MGFKVAITSIFLFSGPAFAQHDIKAQLVGVNPPKEKFTNPDNWMVIVGDSGSTGSGSDPELYPTLNSLFRPLGAATADTKMNHVPPALSNFPNPGRFGIDKVDPMTRVLYSMEEYGEAAQHKNGVQKLNLAGKLALTVDVQEHANGYMIGRALGMKGEDIVLVGQGGARVNAIGTQFARIFELPTETLPPLVLVSFTANDFCSEKIYSDPFDRLVLWFEESLKTSWKKAEPYMRSHPKGTRILVLAPLNVANVLTNDSVLEQKIRFEGLRDISCRQLRNGETYGAGENFLAKEVSKKLTEALWTACPSVLKTKPTDANRLEVIRRLQTAFNDVWKRQIADLNAQYNSKNIRFDYVEGTRDMQFEKGDVANDCFHPGVKGHSKVADYVLKTVFGK